MYCGSLCFLREENRPNELALGGLETGSDGHSTHRRSAGVDDAGAAEERVQLVDVRVVCQRAVLGDGRKGGLGHGHGFAWRISGQGGRGTRLV